MKITVIDDQGAVVETFTVTEGRAPLDPPPPRVERLAALLRDAADLAEAGLTSWDDEEPDADGDVLEDATGQGRR